MKSKYYTQAQNKATQRYNKKVYDEFKIRMAKGKKTDYMAMAKKKGKSLNKYIIELIENDIKKE